MPEPIVDAARERAAASPLEGSGMVKDAADLLAKVGSGDWTEGLVAFGSMAYETRDLLADPLAKMASMGLGWVIEFFGPLRWVLDQLTGDAAQLNLIVETWSGIAGAMASAADTLDSAYTTDTAQWSGSAVAQYRLYCANQVDLYRAGSAAAQSVADNARMSGAMLTAVREIVRGLVTDAIGKAISIACRYPPPLTPAAAPEITSMIASTGSKISQWLGKLKRAFDNAKDLLSQSGRLFHEVKGLLKFSRSITNPAIRSQYMSDLVESVGIIARHGVIQAAKQIPEQLPEMALVETVKGVAGAKAAMADDPESPADQSQLYDGPGPHRITGTL